MRRSSVYKLFGATLAGVILCGLNTVNVSAETLIPASAEAENLSAVSGEIQPTTDSQAQIGLEVDKEEAEETAEAAAGEEPTAAASASILETSMTEALQVSTELELREAVENAAGPVTIELVKDITMTDPYPNHIGGLTQPYPAMLASQYGSERAALFIDAGKDITLIGEHKLIGTGSNTITLHGNLTLDGPIITHMEGTSDSSVGIRVGNAVPTIEYMRANPRAYLLFKSGEVCGNSFVGIAATYGDILMIGGKIYGNGTLDDSYVGGGILLAGNGRNPGISEEAKYGGTAIIKGGEIFDNKSVYGGGIHLSGDYHVSLEISGGNIYDNEAKYHGGGIYSSFHSEKFKMLSGSIYNNKAGYYGGGIYSKNVLNITGGEVRGNDAAVGGGIYTSNHNNLTIGADVKFSGNTADKLTRLLETDEDFAIYKEKISVPNGKWSVAGVLYGYNNYDINYDGSELEFLTVTFLAGEGGSLSGVTQYPSVAQGTPFGRAVTVPGVEAAEGYVFEGWSPLLPSSAQAVTENATYTAIFVRKPVIPTPEPNPEPEPAPKPEPVPAPTDAPKTPELPNSAPKTTINTQPASQPEKQPALPSTGDVQRNLVLVAGGLAVLGAALLGVMARLKGRKH